MEFVQDYMTLLPNILPPSLLNPLLRVLTTTFAIFKTLQSHLTPLVTRLATQPDLTSILVLLAVLFLSLKLLDMAYRAVLFWVNLVFRLIVWGSIVVVGVWVWQRGVDGFVEDVVGLGEHWVGEYEKYSGEVRRWQKEEERRIRVQGARGGRGWR